MQEEVVGVERKGEMVGLEKEEIGGDTRGPLAPYSSH